MRGSDMSLRSGKLEIWKFGGASLADAAGLRRAVGLIRAHKGPVVVVASALAGVTDLLLEGAKRAVAGDAAGALLSAAKLHERHTKVLEQLSLKGIARQRLAEKV